MSILSENKNTPGHFIRHELGLYPNQLRPLECLHTDTVEPQASAPVVTNPFPSQFAPSANS